MSGSQAAKTKSKKILTGAVTFFKRLYKEKPLGAFGFTVMVLFILVAIFAPVLSPYGLNDTNPVDRLIAPCAEYPFGTDNLGRDILSRVIYGTRTSIIVGLTSAVLAVVVATLIGVSSGYLSGKFDMLVQRFVDAVLCVPLLILLIVIISMAGAGTMTLILVMGIRSGIAMSRVIRGATISIRGNTYIRAAVATGCTRTRIVMRHIVPNIMAEILIVFATRVPQLILLEASLSFLGFGVVPPTPSWGGMLSGSGANYMFQAPWMVVWPGLALVVLVYSVNMFADALRDIVDPKLRGSSEASDYRQPSSKKIRRITKGYTELNLQ